MIFRPALAELVLRGNKWVTRRPVSDNPRSPYHPGRIGYMIGRDVAVQAGRGEPAIGVVTVRSVRRHLLDPMRLTVDEIVAEGFATRSGFMGIWADIYNSLGPVEVWRLELANPRRA